jgi:hypothetical protein
MGRVTAEEVRVWRVTAAELGPGAFGCTGTEAADGPGVRPSR